LGVTPEEAGAIAFPDVVDLLEYWLEYPPTHLLLRAWTGFEGKGRRPDSARAKRAEEMGDYSYTEKPMEESEKDMRIKQQLLSSTNVRHADCAPGHIQQAIERAKKGEHFSIPKPE
jgi:hypothetical protein